MKANIIDRIENETAKVSERRNFLKIGGAALVAASGFPISTAAHDEDDKDGQKIVNPPLGAAGLVFGHSLRTTPTNLGSRRNCAPSTRLERGRASVEDAPDII